MFGFWVCLKLKKYEIVYISAILILRVYIIDLIKKICIDNSENLPAVQLTISEVQVFQSNEIKWILINCKLESNEIFVTLSCGLKTTNDIGKHTS